MQNRIRAFTSSLLITASILTSQHTFASESGNFQLQILEERTTSKQDALAHEFNELFLDDWQKLVLAGKNAEAVQVALETEKECCTAMNKEYFKRNTALYNSLYRLSQHRSYLQPDERFSPHYFRIYNASPEKLIEAYQKRIQYLKDELKHQEARLSALREMEQTAPNKRDELKQKAKDDLTRFTSLRDAILSATEDQDIIIVVKAIDEQVSTIYKLFCNFNNQLYGDDDSRQESEKIDAIRVNMWERLNKSGWSQKKEAIQKQYEQPNLDEETKDKLSLLCFNMGDFFSAPLWLASTCTKWLSTEPSSSLSPFDAKELENRVKHLGDLRQDTDDKIAAELSRIEFIKAHPEFFQIQARSRAELLGITNTEDWFVQKPCRSLGHGIIVGVIDSYDSCVQTSTILHKAVNPTFKGSGNPYVINEGEITDHGIGVASIIVSDEIDIQKERNALTIGVAPGAEFEMIDADSISLWEKLTREHGDIHWPEHITWTVPKMAGAISEMVRTGTIAELGLCKNMIGDNPLLDSKSRILNFSSSFSQLKRDGRKALTSFEGLYTLPIVLELLKSRLFIQSLGNDGVNVSSTDQIRLSKAIAYSPDTLPHYIMVTNLMQDGVTLNPTSNTPGEESYLQARTLSAPGTELTVSVLTGDDNGSAYQVNSGTSFSAPHVSGVAAVVLSNFPELTTAQLAQCLLDSATPLLMTENGTSFELSDVTSYELKSAFSNAPDAASIKIQGHVIDRQDWMRGKSCFGQGRVHLENALKLAAAILNKDLT